MNCEEARQKIAIKDVLETFNLFPVKENRRTAFYFALDRDEKVPSFSVDYIKNKAFDFGTGRSYDVVSIVQMIKKCSVSDALQYLSGLTFSNTKINAEVKHSEPDYQIQKVDDLKHLALIQYLESRKIIRYENLVKEVHYKIKGKYFFGVGFYNNSGGIEIRNKYSKICLGQKDITLIRNEMNFKNEVIVFEGFFDYLTFVNIDVFCNDTSDIIVLNSTSMLFRAKEILSSYSRIVLFLDNDKNGFVNKARIISQYKNVEDFSMIYSDFKDLNEWYKKQ